MYSKFITDSYGHGRVGGCTGDGINSTGMCTCTDDAGTYEGL
jgi:hypothetical protein